MESTKLDIYKVKYKKGLIILYAVLVTIFLTLLSVLLFEKILSITAEKYIYWAISISVFACSVFFFQGNFIILDKDGVRVFKYYNLFESFELTDVISMKICLVNSNNRKMYYALQVQTKDKCISLNYITFNKKNIAYLLRYIVLNTKCDLDKNIKSLIDNHI